MPTSEFSHNRQNLQAWVYLIATPIGNLADLSLRAKKILGEIDELWCEDTRVAQRLYQALDLTAPRLRRLDGHSDEKEMQSLLKQAAQKRQKIGFTTDAGTPGIQDPGSKLVRTIYENFYQEIGIEVVPGPSAVTAALSACGFNDGKFCFLGYYPQNHSDRDRMFKKISEQDFVFEFCFFESPHRIVDTIEDLATRFERDPKCEFFFAKELTKLNEKLLYGVGSNWLRKLKAAFSQDDHGPGSAGSFNHQGEWVFIVRISSEFLILPSQQDDWKKALETLILCEVSPKVAARAIQEKYSVAKNLAYDVALQLKKNSDS